MRYEIRSMGLAEILDMGFRVVKDHFVLLTSIAAVIYVPLAMANYLFMQNLVVDPDNLDMGASLGGGVALAFLSLLAMPIVSAAITHAIGESYLGRETTVGDSLKLGLSLFLPLIGTSMLSGLIILVGLALLVVPGIYLMLCYMLITQVIVLERTYGMAALSRSKELVSGHIGRMLGIMLVTWLIMMTLQTGVGFVLNFIPLLGAVGSGIAQSISFAYYSAVLVILYFDLRCRKEAFDLEHLARMVESGGSGTSIHAG